MRNHNIHTFGIVPYAKFAEGLSPEDQSRDVFGVMARTASRYWVVSHGKLVLRAFCVLVVDFQRLGKFLNAHSWKLEGSGRDTFMSQISLWLRATGDNSICVCLHIYLYTRVYIQTSKEDACCLMNQKIRVLPGLSL